MFTMPLSPLILNRTSGDWMWTAASVLSLRTPKLEFDPTLSNDFDGNEDAKEGGLSMLERYVMKLLDESFSDSSLFWHYAMRHVPSQSLMCAKDYSSTTHKPANIKMAFQNDAEIPSDASNPNIMLNLPSNSIPMHGYGAFPIGGALCLCSWARVLVGSVTWCQVPPAICTSLFGSTSTLSLQLQQCRYCLIIIIFITLDTQRERERDNLLYYT
jgi:hypothetical protein